MNKQLRITIQRALDSLDYYRSHSLSWGKVDEEVWRDLRAALAEELKQEEHNVL